MSATQDELNQQVALLDAMLADIDDTLRHMTADDVDVADALQCRATLASPSLGLVRERLDNLLGEALGRYESIVPGFGMVKRHPRKSRTKWDKDRLLRDVEDSRLFDREGTMKDETPLEKVLHVWNLGSPRLTALKERGLEGDDYCAIEERPGWTIENR
jgi:hypothetical protein